MLVGSHAETGDERIAAPAPLPRIIGNIQAVASCGALRPENGTAAQAMVGDPQSRRRAGGAGMMWLTALTFSLMKEVQAADPNVTFLDDGSITYKDLEHGAFELITKEAVPRHIIVEDPGETIVLRPQGSTISVNQTTNSLTRMAELQEAQQDVLATSAKGLGLTGSSTPPFGNSLPVQPINFIQTNGSPPALNALAPPEWISLSTPEIIFGHVPPPPPTLNAVTGPIEIDTVAFDLFTATSGTLVASASDSGATLTFGISGGTAGSTVLDGVTYDVSRTGPYGTLYVNSATGAYTFVPDSGAINALTTPTTTSFIVTVSDGTLSANQTFTIAINGINDAAIISGTTTGSTIEAGGVANATLGTPTATGTLTDTDVDNPPNTFTAVSSPTASDAGYGTFTMTATGVWTYTLNNANSAVQALDVGDTLTDSFTVTTVDGTAQVVTVTISGTNDAAVISGTTTGSVIEAGGVANTTLGAPTATGTLTDTDVDNTSNTFTAVSSPTASDAGYGTFTMTGAGVWTYTLDNANSAVQALNVGGTLTDSFTVTAADGTAQVVTITINGTNDAAIISGTATGSVIEAGSATTGTPTATGTLTDTDVDNTPNTFTAVGSPKASAGGYGTFTMTAAGVWIYTLDDANSAVQALNVGDTLTDSFTVTVVDGTAQVVTVTINGTNDAAIISGTTTGSVIEAGGATTGTPIATGTLTDTDVDNPPNTFTAVSSPTASDAGYGTFTMTAAGVWAYMLDDANSAVQALDVGDTLTDTFTVTAVDGTAQVVTITIHGSSDADPNDFDYLATGTAVISDPPYVYGTPGDDSIAGGGDVGQIIYGGAGDDTINGTGKSDLIYAGSGNDTIKGNDGDDTIYGGSGSDTINANNGSDTIVGGYGADYLTGSNGDDRFVYLSVADSNAAQFDVISDFRSGSDRIDLTALGALAFLALTSASTSVPAHTIAWIYDSTTNQTIVYVNPTDQTLDIGDSGLLEIHLQGIATIQASDFVPEPTAAPVVVVGLIDPELTVTAENDAAIVTTAAGVSFDWTGSDGAQPADGSWTVRTTDAGYNFDEARPSLTDDTEITLESGQSIEQPHFHVSAQMEDSFAFDQTPVLDGAVHGTNITALNDNGAPPWRFEHNQTLEGDGWIVSSHSHADWTINSRTHSNGAADNEDHRSFNAKIVDSTNAADTHAHPTAHVVFDSGSAAMQGLGDSFHFKGEISSSDVSDVIHLAEMDHIPASIGHLGNAAGAVGPPAISEVAIELFPSGYHSIDHFSDVPDQAQSAIAHALHDLIV